MSKKGLSKVLSLRHDSYFSNSKLSLEKIIHLIHLWISKTPVCKAVNELAITKIIVVDWYNFNREVCAQYFIDHPCKIGGPNIEVEIDESKFGRRKYNRGRYSEGHWVFGGIKRVTGESFLVEVEKRDAATLIPIIEEYIQPGSIIYSDQWKAYSSLGSASSSYSHGVVNHSRHFVDPSTGVHTQQVESMWAQVKKNDATRRSHE